MVSPWLLLCLVFCFRPVLHCTTHKGEKRELKHKLLQPDPTKFKQDRMSSAESDGARVGLHAKHE